MIAPTSVGRVVGLYRYPVKSMGGEVLEAAEVTARGVLGDRAYALVDPSTARVASAKRPDRYRGIMDCTAGFTDAPSLATPHPPVRITWPDGTACTSEEPERLRRQLAATFDVPLELRGVVPEGASFEYHWPDMDGLVHEGRTYRDEITEHAMPPGTFFDSASLLLMTTASLDHLRGLEPDRDFDPRRFRPNILIAPDRAEPGFVEDAWVGGTLRIGADVRIEITRRCIRCVMVALAQPGLARDPGILKAAFEHNQGHVGVKGSVRGIGTVQLGDPVRLG